MLRHGDNISFSHYIGCGLGYNISLMEVILSCHYFDVHSAINIIDHRLKQFGIFIVVSTILYIHTIPKLY